MLMHSELAHFVWSDSMGVASVKRLGSTLAGYPQLARLTKTSQHELHQSSRTQGFLYLSRCVRSISAPMTSKCLLSMGTTNCHA